MQIFRRVIPEHLFLPRKKREIINQKGLSKIQYILRRRKITMMKNIAVISVIVVLSLIIVSYGDSRQSPSPKQNTADTLETERQRYIQEILNNIKGKESSMADSVFRKIKTFTGNQSIKATHFLAVMNYWGEALGVSCTSCHNAKDWSSDEKKEKNIARGMYNLRQIINKEISISIESEDKIKPLVNCGTCHRGHLTPKE